MTIEDVMVVVLKVLMVAFIVSLLDQKYKMIRIKFLYRENFLENFLINLALTGLGAVIVWLFL